jgi:hypothetical protein
LTVKTRQERAAWKNAMHEAGHAVVGVVLGFRVREVTAREGTDEHCPWSAGFRGRCLFDFGRRKNTRENFEREVVLDLSGLAAEGRRPRTAWMTGQTAPPPRLWLGDWAPEKGTDEHLAYRFAYYAMGKAELPGEGGQAGTARYLRFLWERTKAIVSYPPHRDAIRAVATLLLERDTIGHKEVKAALNAALRKHAVAARERLRHHHSIDEHLTDGLGDRDLIRTLEYCDRCPRWAQIVRKELREDARKRKGAG